MNLIDYVYKVNAPCWKFWLAILEKLTSCQLLFCTLHRCNDVRLTKVEVPESKQLLVMPIEQLTYWQRLPESSWVDQNIRRPGWFCLGTWVPRHSAGSVGTFVRSYICLCTYLRMYLVHTICNTHVRVTEAENSTTLTSTNVLVLRNVHGFCLWIYLQGPDYKIRTRSQCTCYTSKPCTYWFSCSWLHQDCTQLR